MFRSILATVVGFSVSVIVITVFDSIGHALFPPEPITDPQQLSNSAQALLPKTPPAIMWGLLRYAIGATCGIFIATYYARPQRLPAMLVTGFLISAAVWAGNETVQPLWLQAASAAAILFGAFTGFGLGRGKQPKPGAKPMD
jgi:hypothetical protein